MKEKLKKITNLTINELLSNDIILPSSYFEHFNKNAQNIDLDLEDENFKDKINILINNEFTLIEKYMKLLMSNLNTLEESTLKSKDAILNKDVDTLNEVYKKIEHMQKEIQELNSKIYFDSIPNIYNKKWIYNKFLQENTFKNDSMIILLNINNYDYLNEEYGNLIADNLLTYIVNYINKHLHDNVKEHFIARFFENKFLIFVNNATKEEVEKEFINLQRKLCETTLKSNSGLLLKAAFKYDITSAKKGQEGEDVFENLFS